ncbi:SpoIID/LytB domain-containing protein [Natronoflexus pectinivorans]|uniref:SpoIID/LytB domain protein n=1 Tax=Natronoflexus pectinivorans TaxID=682526 RepID=A0A4R2GJL8_9BACT|nr:SpoIID/LytB domain-containing protein [Natronoflexus pectinivorans]TCO08922.1 SpoIID/LytB domain protein [Natronoflexus pectinivorans]
MQPKIRVGIMFSPSIEFKLHGAFRHITSGREFQGEGTFRLKNNVVELSMNGETEVCELPFELSPVDEQSASFELLNVTIGINFHWERKENQSFKGALKIIQENDHLTAINVLSLDDYLLSVISSEMSATSSAELLKAHSVISRSWLLAQIEKGEQINKLGNYATCFESEGERVKWYDREDHLNFDVCADDHCQRYQGITKATTTTVRKAVESTSGLVLTYDGNICDARYSKCCGGVSELFENVWESTPHPYLTKVVDAASPPIDYSLELGNEKEANAWITGSPDAFCNTANPEILSQVLNDYDRETADFYRWKVTLSQEEIQNLLRTKVGIEVGRVLDLVAMERGVSGRIIRLRIIGTKSEFIIGKELEIRKAFSASHLYSSAFVVEKGDVKDGVPEHFYLRGAGWGHGVGLCQIGAAVMGASGYSYTQILNHYFKGADITKRY